MLDAQGVAVCRRKMGRTGAVTQQIAGQQIIANAPACDGADRRSTLDKMATRSEGPLRK